MTMSAQEFLNMTTDAASEKPPLIPAGEYLAMIMPDGLDVKDFTYKSGDRAGQQGHRLVVKWEIQDEALKEQLGRTPIIVQSVMLNFTETGGLAAENPSLRQLREAFGQNENGKPWQAAMMIGQVGKIQVKHRIDDNGEEQHEVGRVTRAA